jgi:hypothetical protein
MPVLGTVIESYLLSPFVGLRFGDTDLKLCACSNHNSSIARNKLAILPTKASYVGSLY